MHRQGHLLLVPPVFPNDEDATRTVRVLYALFTYELVIIAFATLSTILVFERKLAASLLILLLLLRLVVAFRLTRRGQVRWASLIWLTGFWLFATILVMLSGHIATTAVTLYLAAPVLAGLLLGQRQALLTAILSSLVCLILVILEITGYPLIRYLSDSPLSNWFVLLIAFSFTIPPLHLTLQGFVAALIRARQSEERYRTLSAELEQRVIQRTAELQSVNEDLANALRARDVFLATMSHELRTPLNGILGPLSIFDPPYDSHLTDAQHRAISFIEASGQRLAEIINRVLEFTMLQSGDVVTEPHSCSMRTLCHWLLQALQAQTMSKNQKFLFSITPNDLELFVDERHLYQLLMHLLKNASKFTPDGGMFGIEIKGEQETQQVILAVWDQGIGIEEQDLPRLFLPFAQLDTGRARAYEGIGLGLALVKQLADLLGGQVRAESVVGQGSRFTLTLPWEPLPKTYT